MSVGPGRPPHLPVKDRTFIGVLCPTATVLRVRQEAASRGITTSAYVRDLLDGRAARDHRAYESVASAVRELRDALVAATYQLRGRARIPEDTIAELHAICGRVERTAQAIRMDNADAYPIRERKENE